MSEAVGDAGSLAAHFVLLNDLLHGGSATDAALDRLVRLAVSVIPGCDWAAITSWPKKRPPSSLATSDQVAVEADQLQYEFEEGPCLSAAAQSEMTLSRDLAHDERWPRFGARVTTESPVRSAMSLHLADHPHRTALNLYAGRIDAFDDDAVTSAALFTAHARALLLHIASADKAASLETALTTSRQIGIAVGILMNVHKVSADEAFDLLSHTSQNLNRKLRDVASDVTHTGTLPDKG